MSRVDTDAMRRYEQTRDDLVARLLAIEELIGEERRKTVASTRSRLERGKFVLAVVGEFSSGKSFLLNALLGKFRYEEASGGHKQLVGLLATDINPSTATITELEHGEGSDIATAVYEDGRTERIPLDRLNRFIAVGSGEAGTIHEATKDTIAAAGQVSDAPQRVVVTTNSPFLERGFVVADTPGLASINPAHRRATLQFLPTADAVLYLIDTQQPFTEGDASFLGIVRQHIDSIFIVQTKIDLWQQPQADGKPAWEHAYERIASLAAVHAPGTYVYALSAREYVEGVLAGDEARIEESRFPRFLAALDASLIRRTGRARLRRAAERTGVAVGDAIAQIEADLAMLALDEAALAAKREQVVPALAATRRPRTRGAQCVARRRHVGARAHERARRAPERRPGTRACASVRYGGRRKAARSRAPAHHRRPRGRSRRARVRRARRFRLTRRPRRRVRSARAPSFRCASPPTTRPLRRSAQSPERVFGTAIFAKRIAATIVLDAIGGPAIGLVHSISTRFASRPAGQYMKREMSADLRTDIFPRFAWKFKRLPNARARGCSASTTTWRKPSLQPPSNAGTPKSAASTAPSRLIAAIARRKCNPRWKRAGTACAPNSKPRARSSKSSWSAKRRSHRPIPVRRSCAWPTPMQSFDPNAYEGGLRPSRWRVAVLGALRRGKTSLINAFAGRTVLTDDVAGSVRFPVHVRYGEREQAFALAETGEWREIAFENATAEAERSPVLLLVPWSLPRELVLVHAPAFDSGDPNAEDVNVVVASHASEVLCLFSRQLSDRELSLYERVAEFNKPMLFAHTIADNEAPNERRHVVELAQQYLKERNIPAERVFVVSSHEFEKAKLEKRAPAGWNETEALRLTLEGHAEAHMARLARLARATQRTSGGAGDERQRTRKSSRTGASQPSQTPFRQGALTSAASNQGSRNHQREASHV